MFDIALQLANSAHMGVRDKGGKAYILHPLRIAMRLRTDDEELMCIAILHDAIEDSPLTFEDLKEKGFSKRVINALRLLTHQKGESYDEYINKMRGNYDALRVKREDLRDNSDITRIKGVSEKDRKRMEKYQISYLKISEFIKEIEPSSADREIDSE